MLLDSILSIFSLMQGPSIDESTVHMHKLLISPSTIYDWEAFLRVHVQPGDYIFSANIRSVFIKELSRALRQFNALIPAIIRLEGERCELSFASQYMQSKCRREFFETILRVIGNSHDQPLVRKWYYFCIRFMYSLIGSDTLNRRINTGTYMGPERAWDLYITRLSKCLAYSVFLRDNMNYALVSPDSVGRHLGMMLAGVLDIGSFMLGPVPICS